MLCGTVVAFFIAKIGLEVALYYSYSWIVHTSTSNHFEHGLPYNNRILSGESLARSH